MSLTDTMKTQRDAMLEELPEEWYKSAGSIFWNIVSALAVPLGDEIDRLDEAIQLRDPARMTGDELEIFCKRYGIYRNPAVESTATLQITLDDEVSSANIADGTLFETETGVQFAANQDYTNVRSGDMINVHAVVAGEHGNVAANTITVIPVTVEGVAAVTNPLPGEHGQNEEDDVDLFERWQIKVSYRITGYNKGWYEALALEQPDIGYAKCYAAGETLYDDETVPHGSVYLVVLDDSRKPLDADRLAEVQELFDPEPQATGLGLTPATAFCYVKNGAEAEIAVEITGIETTGTRTPDAIAEMIQDVLTEVFDNTEIHTTIYGARLFAEVMNVDGVKSIDGLIVNNALRYALKYNEVPKLAALNCAFADGTEVSM